MELHDHWMVRADYGLYAKTLVGAWDEEQTLCPPVWACRAAGRPVRGSSILLTSERKLIEPFGYSLRENQAVESRVNLCSPLFKDHCATAILYAIGLAVRSSCSVMNIGVATSGDRREARC